MAFASRNGRAVTPIAAVLAFALALALGAGLEARAAGDPQDDVAAEDGTRLAFVIGNNAYDFVPELANAVNDGKLIAQSLRRLDFDVVEGYDLTLGEMQALFTEKQDLIEEAEAVLFYYAGHGFQLNGRNFLVPVDARLTSAADIPLQTVQIDALVDLMESEDRPTLVFLDACQENPLRGRYDAELEDGLARMDAGDNTYILFATEPGQVTVDGAGNNSPFALAISRHIETPGLSISDFDIAVRNETMALTADQQRPFTQSSLLSQFFFTERQELDQRALLVAYAQIAQDPRQLAAFQEAIDENLSLQAAVFRARQRAADVLGVPAAPRTDDLYGRGADADPAQTVEIGSVATPDASEDELLERLIFSEEDGEEAARASERERRTQLARRLQTELQRLGCYRMAIDGIWGPGSRGALREYLQRTDQTSDSLEPSMRWLARTSLESGRICRAPVIIRQQPGQNVARAAPETRARPATVREDARASFRREAPRGQSRTVQRERRTQRNNALPPDLAVGGGIGF